MEEKDFSWYPAVTGPHMLVDRWFEVILQLSGPDARGWLPWGYLHSLPFLSYLPTSCSIGVSVAQQLWTAPCLPAGLVLAQPGDQRKSSETATETSVFHRTGELTPKARGPGAVRMWQPSLPSTRAEGGYHLRGMIPLIGLSATRKPAAGPHPSQPPPV